jgi:hypothetical protein
MKPGLIALAFLIACKSSGGDASTPPPPKATINLASAGKKDLANYAAKLVPGTVAYSETASWPPLRHTIEQRVSIAHACRVSVNYDHVWERTDGDPGGDAEYGKGASPDLTGTLVGAGEDVYIKVNDSNAVRREGDTPVPLAQLGSMAGYVLVYFNTRLDRDAFVRSMSRLHELCKLGREPN